MKKKSVSLHGSHFVEVNGGHALFQFFFCRVNVVEGTVVTCGESMLGAVRFLASTGHLLLNQG